MLRYILPTTPRGRAKALTHHGMYLRAIAATVLVMGAAWNYSWTHEHNQMVSRLETRNDQSALFALMDNGAEPVHVTLLPPPVHTKAKHK